MYWNDKKVGKTAHIDDTLDPVWDLEIFSVRFDQDGPNSVEESTLRIVCFDWDQFGSDDVLGQIELAGWQIKQLAESKDGDDDAVDDNEEGGMGEADMEKVFHFIRLLQEHEMGEAGLGKMVVGVPQDPRILGGKDPEQEASEAAEVEPSKKKKRKKKRKHGAAEASRRREAPGEEGGADKEPNSSQAQPPETLGSDAADPARNNDTGAPETWGDKTGPGPGPQAERAQQRQTAAVSVEGTTREDRKGDAGEREHSGQDGETAVAVEDGRRPIGEQARVSEVGAGLRDDGNKEGVHLPIPREGHEGNPDTIQAGVGIINVDTLETSPGGTEGNQGLLSEAPPEGEKTLVLGPDEQGKMEQKLASDAAPTLKPGAGVARGSSGGDAISAGLEVPRSRARETNAGDTASDQAPSDACDGGVTTTKSIPDTKGRLLLQNATLQDLGKSPELDADVKAGVTQGSTVRASLDDSNTTAVGTEGKDMKGGQALLPGAPRKGENAPKSNSDRDERVAQGTTPTNGDVSSARQTADVKDGDAQPKDSSTEAGPRAEKDGKATVQNPNAFCYRDGEGFNYVF